MANNKLNKLKNIIQLYTNTENMINNKLAVEWLAKSYVDLLTKLNNEEISLKEFEIQYIELLEQAKEMEKEQKRKDFTDGYMHGNEPLNHDVIDKWYKATYGGKK
jgi:hypothetical protein